MPIQFGGFFSPTRRIMHQTILKWLDPDMPVGNDDEKAMAFANTIGDPIWNPLSIRGAALPQLQFLNRHAVVELTTRDRVPMREFGETFRYVKLGHEANFKFSAPLTVRTEKWDHFFSQLRQQANDHSDKDLQFKIKIEINENAPFFDESDDGSGTDIRSVGQTIQTLAHEISVHAVPFVRMIIDFNRIKKGTTLDQINQLETIFLRHADHESFTAVQQHQGLLAPGTPDNAIQADYRAIRENFGISCVRDDSEDQWNAFTKLEGKEVKHLMTRVNADRNRRGKGPFAESPNWQNWEPSNVT